MKLDIFFTSVIFSARSIFRNLPNVDTESPVAVFAGAPNVGKSSLIGAVSTGKPEVKSYPFTTKAVSLGHIMKKYTVLQVMDTPGLLDRSDLERNDMEKQGIAAFDYLEPIIVFLTDLTGTSGYSIEMQTNLRDELRLRYPKCEWIDVFSKKDLDFEDEIDFDGSISVSAYKEQGIEEFKDKLLSLIL